MNKLGRGLGDLMESSGGMLGFHIDQYNNIFTPVFLDDLIMSDDQQEAPLDMELVESLKSNGLQEPIVVRTVEDGYELIDGAKRVIAARAAGLTELQAKLDDFQSVSVTDHSTLSDEGTRSADESSATLDFSNGEKFSLEVEDPAEAAATEEPPRAASAKPAAAAAKPAAASEPPAATQPKKKAPELFPMDEILVTKEKVPIEDIPGEIGMPTETGSSGDKKKAIIIIVVLLLFMVTLLVIFNTCNPERPTQKKNVLEVIEGRGRPPTAPEAASDPLLGTEDPALNLPEEEFISEPIDPVLPDEPAVAEESKPLPLAQVVDWKEVGDEVRIKFPTALFKSGRVELNANAQASLSRVATEIKMLPEGKQLLIIGHSNPKESSDPFKLGQQRADKVRDLLQRELPTTLIKASSRGPINLPFIDSSLNSTVSIQIF